MRKKKKTGKILLSILLLIVVLLAALAFWQRDNLKALYRAKTMDADAILAEAEVQTEQRRKELEAYGVTLKVPTREEMDALLNGQTIEAEEKSTPREETAALLNDQTIEAEEKSTPREETAALLNSQTIEAEEKSTPREETAALLNGQTIEAEEKSTPREETADENAVKDIIERCIQELYDCETALMARLGEMKQAALDEWRSLPDEERTKERKLEIGRRGLDDCYKLEVEIDAQVQDILARYRAELEAAHTDTAPMDTLWAHYCEEKTSTKAYYFNKYL